ncbi:hypothetical protein CVT26_011447 [Gymnopilus dilepis]|uniref:HMG box domain-containing protein n=1 Tax=Gymnopilus dilepis TaxID=231916 RepID=A0A409W8P8_9AGAR|nr:hypothetical protein CVT26_011447 [Gymnopilus dilepis]
MPAERRKTSKQEESYDDNASIPTPGMDKTDFSFAPNVTATSFEHSGQAGTPDSTSDSDMYDFEDESQESSRVHHGRKKPANHIPRPPNAFILFRSSFIKGRHVSTGVETNHSTLSKIIGLTWQGLPEDERQKWHARAKIALTEHRRRFPQYTFRPIHTKRGKTQEKKKSREVGPKDEKRCAKIAELLVCGKKGQELEEAIQEFDKHHVPEIITRFEEPITASAFSDPTMTKADAPPVRRKASADSSRRSSCRASVSSSPSPLSPRMQVPSHVTETLETPPVTPFENSPYTPTEVTPHFDFDSFSFPMEPAVTVLPTGGQTFTQVVSPPIVPFEGMTNQDLSRLSVNTCYPATEEWTRRGSPTSISTGSMPSTPAEMGTHFPESYGAYASEVQQVYAPVPLDGTYSDYSKFPFPSMSDHMCNVKGRAGPPVDYPHFCPDIADAPMMRQDHDFSTLMQSLNSYSL